LIDMSLPELVATAGYLGLFAIVFSESGLPFGFIFPGDSLLFTAGLVASQGYLAIVPLAIVVTVAAILGDSAGYWIGKKFGPALFSKEDSFFFNPKHLVRTEAFYQKHGTKTIVLARFVPAVRTFAPILAGMGSMRYATFLKFNVIGGIIWGVGFTVAGYFLGGLFPNLEHYITWIALGIVLVSVIPIGLELLKEWKKSPHEGAQGRPH
ncbi:MAG: VTT domain-containing protein, partial [Patescibacteria group bacterium]